MKHALAFILLFTVWVSSGQTVVDPHTFTQETNPDNSNFEFYSRATGVNRRATFNNVRKRMTPTAQQTSIAYYPAPTGNTSNLGEVVRDPSGNIWYIDGLGQALRLNAMVAGSGITIAGDTITAADTDPLNEAWTIDADDADQEVISSQVVKFQGAGINVTDYNPGTNTLLITGTEVDGSTTNEIQQIDTLSFSGSTLSVSLSSDGVPAKTVSIPAGTFDRFAFSTTAPSDTNYIWAKTNSAPWKLDSVFSYEFGSWHLRGFYDRIGGLFSEKPPLFVVATGQSNMLGIDGGGDTTTDRRVLAWDTTAHVWKVAKLGVNPFNSTGANSLAFAFAREVARRENRMVRLVVMAKASQPIENWFGSGTGSIAYNTNLNVLQSGMTRADAILWHQGESNYDGAGGVCNADDCYTDSLYAIIRQFRGYSWADEQTLFIAGGLFDGVGATQQDRNTALRGLNSDTISTTGFAYATGLDDSGDAVHFSGPALVTLGAERYYNVWRSLPGLYNHTAGSGGGGLTLPTGTHDGQILTWNGSAWEEYSGSAHGNGLYWDSTNGWQEYGLTASNLFFASSGTPSTLAKPAMRAIVAADLPAIDLTSGVTGTLPAANGGTGNASYTTGDILYASGATTLSKLADVATGNALISGGVGVAPSYGKIGLTTHVSGTLPVANGGTGATSLTANRILVGNGTSAISNSANLTFDLSTLALSHTGTRSISSSANMANHSGTFTSTANGVVGVGLNLDQTFTNDGTRTSNQYKQYYGSFTVSGSTSLDYLMGRQLYMSNYSPNVTNFYGDWITCLVRPATGTATKTIIGSRIDVNRYDATDDAHNATGLFGKVADLTSTGRYNIGIGLNYTVESAKTATGISTTTDHKKGSSSNTAYGIQLANNATGSGVIVSNAYGIRLSSAESGGAVITNYYGIYQNTIPTGGTLTYFLYNGNDARSYTNGSFAIGTDATTSKLLVRGTGTTSSTYSGIFEKSDGTDVLAVRDDGLCAIGGAPVTGFSLYTNGATRTDGLGLFRGAGSATGSTTAAGVRLYNTSSTETYNIAAKDGGGAAIYDNGGAEAWTMTAAGLIGMGDTSPEEKLDVDGNVKALHYIGQSTAPGVVKGADNVVGTAAYGATVSLSGTDAGFEVTLTTGSAGISTTGDLFTVTFNTAYGAAPVVVYSASNAAAGSYPLTGYTYSTATTTTVVLTNAVTNLTDETDYKWSFVVMGK